MTIREDMMDTIPEYYRESHVVNNKIDRESEQWQKLNDAVKDVFNQFFIDTATWGLARWEKICGLPTYEDKPYDERRAMIKSRIRGVGVVTVSLIQNVAESFLGAEVDVFERFDTYTIEVVLVGKRGIPFNVEDIRKAMRDIIPAHLLVEVKFTYLRFDELDQMNWTWDELDALMFTFDDLEVYKPPFAR